MATRSREWSSFLRIWIRIPEFVAFFGAKQELDVVLRCNDNNLKWEVVRIDPHVRSAVVDKVIS
jgi:hypothetical protein